MCAEPPYNDGAMRKIQDIKEIRETPLCEQVALGTGTAIELYAVVHEGKAFVGVLGKGLYSFTHYVTPCYMMEKVFNDQWYPDAEVVANWLNKVMGWDVGTVSVSVE